MRDGLLRAGYAVHGDPDALLPAEPGRGAGPSDAGVLALALRLLLDHDADATGDTDRGSHDGCHDGKEATM